MKVVNDAQLPPDVNGEERLILHGIGANSTVALDLCQSHPFVVGVVTSSPSICVRGALPLSASCCCA